MRIRIPQGVLVLRRQPKVLAIAFVVSLLCSAALLAGCGSAGSEEYHSQVTGLNEAAAGKLEEINHLLSEVGSASEEERVEAVAAALEEAASSLQEIMVELEEVKVPAGMEDFHRELIAFYQASLATFEGCLTTLEPGESHAGSEEHGEEENAETHEEDEQASEGETPHGEKPGGGGGH